MRWYKALAARGKNTVIHAMDHEGGPACGRQVNAYNWRRIDADATCPACQARIAATVSLGPVGFANSRILTVRA